MCTPEAFSFDPWGNILTLGANTTTQPNYVGCTQESGFNYTGAIASNNRLAASGFSYDAAGNMTASPGLTYVYDAENHLVTTAGVTYAYDGDGKRLSKSSGTMYWYGLDSDPLIETDLSNNLKSHYIFFNGQRVGSQNASNQVNWYFADHLGSSRLVFSVNGDDQSDFYPYGGERVMTTGVGNHYKFTGKERDSETGLDNFGARFDSPVMGRWMAPDRLNVTDDRVVNPSTTLNKYLYGANNPLHFVDSDGRDIVAIFEPPSGGMAGHFMLFAENSSTGESAMMSYGPVDSSLSGLAMTATGGPVPATQTYGWPQSSDELRQNNASLSIQTTPEQAQEVINFIKNFSPSSGDYKLFSKNCSTVCRDALQAIGLLPQKPRMITPSGLWNAIFARYANLNALNDWYRNGNVPPHQEGVDYGNPRFGMNTFDYIMLALRRACVTLIGPDGHGGSMPITSFE